MNWSLNEIEALAKKATRGAGYTWGLAEEAGKATRWLCAMDLPGTEFLSDLLEQTDGATYAALCPQDTGGAWEATGGALCPLIAGAAMCDLATDLAGGREIRLGRVLRPVLLYPYVAAAADMSGASLSLSWHGAAMTRHGGRTFLSATDAQSVNAPETDSARIALMQEAEGEIVRRKYRGVVSPAAAEALNRLAHRTYAPETEERRLAGAGAGLTDND